jgi:HK97 family phage prohead protease
VATKPELRSATTQLRAAKSGTDFIVEGIAAPYNRLANMGQFREVIKPGAFQRSLSSGKDVKALLNHDTSKVLGRLQNGTLVLRDTADGLAFRCQLDVNNTMHRDLHASITRGDISECSFGFTVVENGDDWAEATDERGKTYIRRTIKDVNLFEISCVAFPAYSQGTVVQARSAAEVDWRTAMRARLAQLDADMDKITRAKCAAIEREIFRDK